MKAKFCHRTLFILLMTLPYIFAACSSDKTADKETAMVSKNTGGQLWTCGMHPEVIMDEPGQCPKCGMNLVPLKKAGVVETKATIDPAGKDRKILYWQAPMDPTEIYDKPGKSKMGMDLVPVYADQISSGSRVKIDPVTVQNMGVRTAPVERVNFTRTIRTVGNVDYNEENIYVVSSKVSGWIEKLIVNYTGQQVRKGQTLLDIYSPDLVTTQQEYLLALKNRELVGNSKYASIREGAESMVNSSRQRLAYWDIPEAEIKRLETTGEVHKTLALESPANGIILHKNAEEGMHIKEGMSLYRIADLSTIWVYASIYDNEVPWVRTGQKADMDLSYAPGKTLEGKVSYIYPYLDEKARDVRVRIVFPNPELKLKPGMYANVRIHTAPIMNALVVPSEAVIRSGQRNVVFIDRGEGLFEPREVVIGEESEDGKLRIISGLLGNEKVVTSAQFLLDSESRLQEAIQKMLEQKSVGKNPAADKMDMNGMDMKK